MMCAPIVRAIAAEPGRVTFQLDVPADMPCFRGHYPDFPILAGVVQIDWVMQLAASSLNCSRPATTEFRIKFKRIITPEKPLTLMLRHDALRHRLEFVYRAGELIASEGRILLAEPRC